MITANTKCVLMSTREEVKATVTKWIGETNCFAVVDGKTFNAIYQPTLDILYINDLEEV